MKCGRVVVGEAIGESDLKEDFQQFALQVDKIIEKELPLCRAAENVKDKYKCVNYDAQLILFYFQKRGFHCN